MTKVDIQICAVAEWAIKTRCGLCNTNVTMITNEHWLRFLFPPISFPLSSCSCLILPWLCWHHLLHVPNNFYKARVSDAFRLTEGPRRWRVVHHHVARPVPSPGFLTSLVFRNVFLWDSITKLNFSFSCMCNNLIFTLLPSFGVHVGLFKGLDCLFLHHTL